MSAPYRGARLSAAPRFALHRASLFEVKAHYDATVLTALSFAAVGAAGLAFVAGCKSPARPGASDAGAVGATSAPADASAIARNDAPPDETFWVGELTPGAVERQICFASTAPLRSIEDAAADADSFLFVARVVAQGWTERPSANRKRVGSVYLDVIDPLRGDAIRPGTLVAMPIDEEPCRDAGPCTQWGAIAPNSTVVVGCTSPKPHAQFKNAIASVAGPRATAVDELRVCVKTKKCGSAANVDAGKKKP